MILRMKKISFILCAVVALGLTALPALAALPEKPGEIAAQEKPTIAYVVGCVLLLMAGVVAFKPSKRTHLD